MTLRMAKNLGIYVLGMLVGMWMAYTMPMVPTMESCEQYLEQVAC